jgi:hypothetical protein
VLDLVDDRRDPLLEQPLVEGARRRHRELGVHRQAGGLGEQLDRLAGDALAHEDQLDRRVQVEDEPRAQPLDERDQRAGLRLRGRLGPGGGAARAVRQLAQLRVDPGRERERRLRAPARAGEVAVQVDAGRVLARPGEEAVGVRDLHDRPRRLVRGDPLEQPPREQARLRLLAVLRRDEQPLDRPLRELDAQRQPAARAAVLLLAPAREQVRRPHAAQISSRASSRSRSR